MNRSLEEFINRENIKNVRKRLEAPADEAQQKILLKLLAEEEAKARQFRPASSETKPLTRKGM
jgi:hypothetical protein